MNRGQRKSIGEGELQEEKSQLVLSKDDNSEIIESGSSEGVKYANAVKFTTNLGNTFNSSVKEVSRHTDSEKLMEGLSKESKKQEHKKKISGSYLEVEASSDKSLVGSKTNESSLVGVELKKDTWDLYVANLQEDVCENDIENFLKGNSIDMRLCYLLPSKGKGTTSAQVRISLRDKDKVLTPSFRPLQVRVCLWVMKPGWAVRREEVHHCNTDDG